jgi:hypothetical protein
MVTSYIGPDLLTIVVDFLIGKLRLTFVKAGVIDYEYVKETLLN